MNSDVSQRSGPVPELLWSLRVVFVRGTVRGWKRRTEICNLLYAVMFECVSLLTRKEACALLTGKEVILLVWRMQTHYVISECRIFQRGET